MTTATKNDSWAPLANPEGKNLNAWQRLRPVRLATIPPRDAPSGSTIPSIVSRVRATLSANQSITSGVFTAINLDAEAFDTDSWHDLVTNTSRLVFPGAFGSALVHLSGGVVFAANATGSRFCQIRKNGATIIASASVPSVPPGSTADLNISVDDVAVAGDYYELVVAQDSGGALNALGGTTQGTFLAANVITSAASGAGGANLAYAGTTDLADVAAVESAGVATSVPRGDHVHAHASGYLPDAHHAQSHNHSASADGTALVPASVDVTGYTRLSGDISPAQITADQNDYNPTNLATSSVLRLTTDAARNITGIQGGADGRVLIVYNIGSFSITLKNASASSTAANRFALNADLVLKAGGGCELIYDSTASRWVVFAQSDVGTGGGGSAGTPALTYGTSNATGAATTFIATDASVAVFDATAPVTQAFSDAAATGSAAFAARRDHKHGMPASPSGTTTTAYKTADQAVTSSTALVNDTHLTFAIGASEKWVVRMVLKVDGATGGDFKATVVGPTGATGWVSVFGPGTSATTFDNATVQNQISALATAPSVGTLGAGNTTVVFVDAYVTNSTNTGSITLQWAQATSSGTATNVFTGSFLTAWKVA